MKTYPIFFWAAMLAIAGCDKSQEPAGHTTQKPESAAPSTDEHSEERAKLTPEQIANSNIGIDTAGPADIREALSVYGVIAPNAERVREVGARFPGVVLSVGKIVGDSVRKGDTLATIESNESLQTYAIVAPLDGVIIARQTNPGEQTGDKTLFTVADLSTVWVDLSLFPKDVARVRVGQVVTVKSTDTNLSAEGKIVYVAPMGTSASQTLSARVLLDNATRQWATGLYVSADIALSQAPVPVAVKSQAVQTYEENAAVFVRNAEGFEARRVRTGRADDRTVEIVEGLAAGEQYASTNSFIVKAELGKGSAEHED
jgi:cobalt-zinc-cadmium efflux system membrane fusion protein